MRTESEMMELILSTAREDERIRAVWMNGSRVNPNAKRDIMQDYDVVYVVKEINSFQQEVNWVDRFGERVIMQIPNPSPWQVENNVVTYLMQFKDVNRIDLHLVPVEKVTDMMKTAESLTEVLLDKDGVIPKLPPASDRDYYVSRPSVSDFNHTCNEFWWVMPYVAKGLWRGEVLYAKGILEGPLRNALMQMLDWSVAIDYDFKISTGKFSKELHALLDQTTWNRLLDTFPTAHKNSIWQALEIMGDLFHDVAKTCAQRLGFNYNEEEEQSVRQYMKRVKNNEI
ncbi:aminoglycoside 6-adenylyltransferase [Piscibacillus halophilus]|uniref:aminoglycoside 6-adenylyltransferase n=1 Tax=Piscibacillus halophilus TaxID=571933 RepID=UPI001589C8D5|nr:aminoglycoside 6-adenylyltransferase [Piscibacillus halophilus]